MARKTKRSSRRHSRSRKHKKYVNKNVINKTLKRGFSTVKHSFSGVKTTSKKYMPRVKSGIEGVGAKVTETAVKTIPVLQKTTRDLFGAIGIKKKH
jgi:hypothetical protein